MEPGLGSGEVEDGIPGGVSPMNSYKALESGPSAVPEAAHQHQRESVARFRHLIGFAGLLLYALCVYFNRPSSSGVFFVERDPTLSFPYKTSQVPVSMLAGLSVGVPCAYIVLCTILFFKYKPGMTSFLLNVVNALFYLLTTLAQVLLLSDAVTNTIKVLVLRPRPNFFAYCNYKGFRTVSSSGNYTAYNAATITNIPGSSSYCLIQDNLPDATLSFPSGHSSLSWAGMTFCAMLVKYTIELYTPFKVVGIHGLLFAAPLYLSGWIAITRIQDYYHHCDDVMMGSFIGAASALYIFQAGKELLDEFVCQKRLEGKIE